MHHHLLPFLTYVPFQNESTLSVLGFAPNSPAPLLEPKDPARSEYRRDNRIADGQVRRVTGDKLGQAAQTKLPVDEVVTASGNLVAAKESLIQSQATSSSVRRTGAEATLDF